MPSGVRVPPLPTSFPGTPSGCNELVMSSPYVVDRGVAVWAGAKGVPRELRLSGLSAVGTVGHRMLSEMWWLFSVFRCARIEILLVSTWDGSGCYYWEGCY